MVTGEQVDELGGGPVCCVCDVYRERSEDMVKVTDRDYTRGGRMKRIQVRFNPH